MKEAYKTIKEIVPAKQKLWRRPRLFRVELSDAIHLVQTGQYNWTSKGAWKQYKRSGHAN